MFYVHDTDGIRFRGPLEQLEKDRRIEQSRSVQPLTRDSTFSEHMDNARANAASTYRKMIEHDNMVEPLVHIYQIMSSPVSTIRVDVPVIDAWWMLKQGRIRQLVVTTSRRRVIGILADRDILRYINVMNENVYMDQRMLVSNIVPGEVITTDSMSDIRRVARVMVTFHVDAMPVLENENLVGIVTRGDILRGFADNPKLNLWA